MKTRNKGFKMKLPEAIVASIVAVFAPIHTMIIITVVLILVDLISGVIAARKKNEVINSGGLRRTVTKFSVYLTAICLGFLVEHYMIADFMPLSKLISGVISLVELKSILENMDTINGSSLFKSLIEKLGSMNDINKPKE